MRRATDPARGAQIVGDGAPERELAPRIAIMESIDRPLAEHISRRRDQSFQGNWSMAGSPGRAAVCASSDRTAWH